MRCNIVDYVELSQTHTACFSIQKKKQTKTQQALKQIFSFIL